RSDKGTKGRLAWSTLDVDASRTFHHRLLQFFLLENEYNIESQCQLAFGPEVVVNGLLGGPVAPDFGAEPEPVAGPPDGAEGRLEVGVGVPGAGAVVVAEDVGPADQGELLGQVVQAPARGAVPRRVGRAAPRPQARHVVLDRAVDLDD